MGNYLRMRLWKLITSKFYSSTQLQFSISSKIGQLTNVEMAAIDSKFGYPICIIPDFLPVLDFVYSGWQSFRSWALVPADECQ